MGTTAHPQTHDPLVIWEPQPGPQTALVTCPVFEVIYGGARGGGKTDGMLGDWLSHSSLYEGAARGLMVRRKRVQLVDTIRRAKEIYLPLGAKWREQEKTFTMPNGAILRMAYLESDSDAEEYQGHSYTRVYIEELTNFPDEAPIKKLKATLRSAEGVTVGFRASCNPGGPGHVWVKSRYIDPNPGGYKVIWEEFINPFSKEKLHRDRVFIPARLSDNKMLMDNDPMYVATLQQSGSELLVRAWLEGDWNVALGAYFDCWSQDMIVKPFKVPDHWTRFRSMDWGYARPFSVGWWAMATETVKSPCGQIIPAKALVRYREWYGIKTNLRTGEFEPNVGIRQDAETVGRRIPEMQKPGEKILYHVADPSMFSQDGGPSLAKRCYEAAGDEVPWRHADNTRVPQRGAMSGWDQMRARMVGEEIDEGVQCPMVFVFDTCIHSIRTIPTLVHDEKNVEDIDTDGEDHAGDEWRYGLSSRPYTSPKPQEKKPMTDLSNVTLDKLWQEQERAL